MDGFFNSCKRMRINLAMFLIIGYFVQVFLLALFLQFRFLFDSIYAEFFSQTQKTSAQHFLHLNYHNNAILEHKN